MSMMDPGMGQSQPAMQPKHLMTMLATLMLNKRLQQGQKQQGAMHNPVGMPLPGQNPNDGGAGGNRMAQLAQMQLNMGGRKPPMTY